MKMFIKKSFILGLFSLIMPIWAGANIDVMLVFDKSAKAWVDRVEEGGIQLFAIDAVAKMNMAMANSGVDLRFNLVHAMTLSNYTYDASVELKDSGVLTQIRQGTDEFSIVHELRDIHAADVVALLVDTGSASGNVGRGYTLSTLEGSPDYAYTINAVRSVDISHTMTHEIGHNLGCHHAYNQGDSPGPNSDLNEYSSGYYFTGLDDDVAYHTIMAYNYDGRSDGDRGNSYTAAPLFSSPLRVYQGTIAGNTTLADNARTIRETMGVVASYRNLTPLLKSPGNEADVESSIVRLEWYEMPGASEYWLVVRGPNDYVFSSSLGIAYEKTLSGLNKGTYKWDVHAKVGGVWRSSDSRYFDVIDLDTPGVPTQISPSGTLSSGGTLIFSWNAAPRALQHQIWISKEGSQFYHNTVRGTSLGVSTFTSGSYSWWLRGESNGVYGAWVGPMNFSVPAEVPGRPTLTSPSGTLTVGARRPTFSWRASGPAASHYKIFMQRNGQTYLNRWVQGATSWTPSSDLPVGSYRWWVIGWNRDGYGSWSQPVTFSVPALQPGAITLIDPRGYQSSSTVTFRWNKDARATAYRLWVSRPTGGVWHDRWYSMSGTGTAQATVSRHPGGTSRWYVRGWGPDGYGPWSSAVAFSTPDPAPAKPVLISPSGRISSRRPSLSWETAARAEWYRVYIQNRSTGRTAADGYVQSTDAHVTSDMALGNYRWWVASWNAASSKWVWSNPLEFTISSTGYRYNISLTWGASPSDLDAHLFLPSGREVYHADKGSQTSYPYAKLDVDDTTGYGPENIGIYQIYSGTYQYIVYNYTGGSGGAPYLAGSGARVRVIGSLGQVLLNRTVPTTGTGTRWHVFNLNAQTGQITLVNRIY